MNEWIERARREAEAERTRILTGVSDVLADYARIDAAIVALGGESQPIATDTLVATPAPARVEEGREKPEPAQPEPAEEPSAEEPPAAEEEQPPPQASNGDGGKADRGAARLRSVYDYLRQNGPTERVEIGEKLDIPKGSWGTLLPPLEQRFGIRSVLVPRPGSGRGISFLLLPDQRLPEAAPEAEEETIPSELADMPALKGRENARAHSIEAARKQKELWDAIVAQDGPFIILELVDEVSLSQERIGSYLRVFADEGMIRPTGAARRDRSLYGPGKPAVEYEVTASVPKAPAPDERPTDGAAATVAPPEDLSLEVVRDCSREMDGPFSPAQMATRLEQIIEGVEVSPDDLSDYINVLVERGTLADLSPTPDQLLYEYVKPVGPGRAAELDAERRRVEGTAGAAEGGAPVPGTGRPERAPHGNVTALLKAVDRAGGQWRRTSDSHFLITLADGRRATIGGTPGSGGFRQDSLKLRKMGVQV